MALLDTNILLRIVRPADPDHMLVRTVLRRLWQRGEERHYLSQNLIEFWAVRGESTATRRGWYPGSPLHTERRPAFRA